MMEKKEINCPLCTAVLPKTSVDGAEMFWKYVAGFGGLGYEDYGINPDDRLVEAIRSFDGIDTNKRRIYE